MAYTKRSIDIDGVIIERYFAPYEFDNLKAIDPLFFFAGGGQDQTLAFHALQKSFHVLLRKFLKVRKEDFPLVARREAASVRYLAALLDPNARGALATRDPAALVCAAYELLKTFKPRFATHKTAVREFDIPFDLDAVSKKNPSRHYTAIASLKKWIEKNLGEYVSLFIVHGSFATGDFFDGWSDLDTAVVLKDDVFSSPRKLAEARERLGRAGLACYLVDPLAHHELMVFTAFDQEYYQDDTLPLSAYENGMLLYGEKRVRFVRRDSHDERLHRLAWYAAWYRSKVTEKKWADNQYDWKNDAGTALLMSAMAVGAKDEYPYKRESFARARELYPQIDWSIVDEVSSWRADWGARSWVQHLPLAFVAALPYDFGRRVMTRLLRGATRKRPQHDRETRQRVTTSILELMESILKANV